MDVITLFSLDIIDNDKPVLIAGPTASGKSALALRLAEQTGGIIVNADALQVYSCWRVLSARPPEDDLARAPHALYGHVPCDTTYSVGIWLREVADLLKAQDRCQPIIVGGTGLYFTALTEGLAEIPEIPDEVRQRANARIEVDGLSGLLRDLEVDDPETLARIDRQNPMRVQRAWEVLQVTGRSLASWQEDTPPPLLTLNACNAFVLDMPKDILIPRINARFRQMFDDGALEECRQALPDWDPSRPSSRAIGAQELIGYLRGESDLNSACLAAEIATRQYAKRQRSWFRARMKSWVWLDAGDAGG